MMSLALDCRICDSRVGLDLIKRLGVLFFDLDDLKAVRCRQDFTHLAGLESVCRIAKWGHDLVMLDVTHIATRIRGGAVLRVLLSHLCKVGASQDSLTDVLELLARLRLGQPGMGRVTGFKPGVFRPNENAANANLFRLRFILPVEFLDFLVADPDTLLEVFSAGIGQDALTGDLEGSATSGCFSSFCLTASAERTFMRTYIPRKRVFPAHRRRRGIGEAVPG